MANVEKMTKVQLFEAAIRIISSVSVESEENNADYYDEVLEGLQHEIDMLERKKEKSKAGETKAAREKAAAYESKMVEIENVMNAEKRLMTATEIGEKIGESVQKTSALLKKMVDSGRCSRVVEKKKAYFTIDAEDAGKETSDAISA